MRRAHTIVIPAQAGTQSAASNAASRLHFKVWAPAFAGVTEYFAGVTERDAGVTEFDNV